MRNRASRRGFVQGTLMGAVGAWLPDTPWVTKLSGYKGLKITEVRVTPVATADPPVLNAAGLHAPYALRTIVELVTADGLSGISEIHGGEPNTVALQQAAGHVQGYDAFDLNALYQRLQAAFVAPADAAWNLAMLRRVFGAYEVACLDIIGKAVERPMCDLLGGKVRDRVPFAAYLFYKYEGAGGDLGFDVDAGATGWAAVRQQPALNAEGLVAQAVAMCEAFGFRSLKLKGGVFDPKIEVATLRALRAAFGPKVPLRHDPNAVWTVPTALHYIPQLMDLLEYFEDPVAGQEAMSLVRRVTGAPLATNMCTTAFEHLPGSIRLGSEDIILIDHHYWGGIKACMDLTRICEVFGRRVSMHSNSHMGISLAAMVHLGAAIPDIDHDLDTHYPWQSDEVIVGGRIAFEDGSLPVPSLPGLGVELDHAALARLHNIYKTSGLTRRDDKVEMQKKIPGWTRRTW